MNVVRMLQTYVSIKLGVSSIIMIGMYALYWPLFVDSTCRINLFRGPWLLSLWTLLPVLPPLLVGWFDQIKRKKHLDLDGISYMLIIINVCSFYGGLSFLALDTTCSLL